MNVNLHIGSIVLDGIELGAGDDRMLQQVVSSELVTMLTRAIFSSSVSDSSDLGDARDDSIRIGFRTDVTTLGPKLANVIYSCIPSSQFGPAPSHWEQT